MATPAVLEERMNNMIRENSEAHSAILAQVTEMNIKFDEICEKFDKKYVTQDRFGPVEKVVYGLVALILTGVITAILVFILKIKL